MKIITLKGILFCLQGIFVHMAIAQTQGGSLENLRIKFLDIVQKNAYQKSNIDWPVARASFLEETAAAKSEADLEPHFAGFLKALNDSHSSISYMVDDEDELDVLERYASITYEQAGYPPLRLAADLIDGGYAYLNIPGVVLEQRKYVEMMGRQLLELDARSPKAWIFDLTENDGGSIVPMLWHMYNLIDQDSVYSFVDGNGVQERQGKKMWDAAGDSISQRLLDLFKLSPVELEPVKLKHTDIPIIILTSRKTASSGEFFVAAFKGQKNVTIIGRRTNGLTSGNEAYPIGKDYLLNLTTAVLQDREGKVYKIGEGIQPDITLELGEENKKRKMDDPAVKSVYLKAATDHLAEQLTVN